MKLGEKYGVKVTVAVETSKQAEGNYISFYEEGKRYMANQLKIVNTNCSTSTAFDGFAIEYLASWMALKN